MPKTYTGGGYSVTINDDGSIKVKPGDWLSKYSMAIHGNTSQVYEYLRKQGNSYTPITNVDLIQAGETIFHKPSIPIKIPGGEEPPMLDVDKIIRDSGLPPRAHDPLTWLINEKRAESALISFVGTFVELGVVGGLNAAGGAILGILASCYALWKARNYGIKQAGMRGTSYGAVAWAFGDGQIPLPTAMVESIKNGVVVDKDAEIEAYKQNWSQAVSISQSKLDNYCQANNLKKEEVQIALQAWSLQYGKSKEPRPEWLAAGLILDTAEQHYTTKLDRRNFLQPWSWYPNDRYIGAPNYPAWINNRYWKHMK